MMLYVLLVLYILWIFYLAVMNLYRANKEQRLTGFIMVLGYITIGIGAFIDVFVNITIASIVFLDRPRTWMLTKRLALYQKGEGWRKTLSLWICANLLNKFDPSGNHCK